MERSKLTSTFNVRLKELMIYYQLKQVDIVNKTGISKALMSRYLSNDCNAKINNVKKIADAYNVSPLWLMGFDCDMFKSENLKEKVIAKIENLNNEDLEKVDRFIDVL